MANKSNKSTPAPVIPVILSGGSGTRLWPLSRKLKPKQFLPLVTDNSLLQDTLLRLQGLENQVEAPIVVCNEAHRFVVAEHLREIDVEPRAIVLEPEGRNTAPAVAVAALLAAEAGNDAILLVLPADHVIRDAETFCNAIETAISVAAAGKLVTFGIVPDKPETGYGYIRRGEDQGEWAVLDEFVEKPDLDTAERYVQSGQYLWNSGMFVLSAADYLHELAQHAPAMVDACRAAVAGAQVDRDFTRLGDAFLGCPADSIDYAVMEKTDRAVVVPLAAGWSDVGSWAALHEILDKDAQGNVLRGDVIVESVQDSYISSAGRLIAAIGLEGVVVVETEDTVLVMSKAQSQRIKRTVDALEEDRVEVSEPSSSAQREE